MNKNNIDKISRWCAYQERSEYETLQKLQSWGINHQDIPAIIQYLKEEDYLNEKRFAHTYIHGKLNHKKWGIEKIKYHLKHKHHLSDELINQGLQNIDTNEYLNTLERLITKKKQLLEEKEKDQTLLKKKIINFALSKGYALTDILKIVKKK